MADTTTPLAVTLTSAPAGQVLPFYKRAIFVPLVGLILALFLMAISFFL